MIPESIDYVKGETPMTDYQFKSFIELRDKYEDLLRKYEAATRDNSGLIP